MFENKLEEASRRSRQQMLVGGLLIAIIALAVALFVVMQRVENISVTADADDPAAVVVEQNPNPKQTKTKSPIKKVEAEKPEHSNSDVLKMLTRFEGEFEKTILSEPFGVWGEQRQKALVDTKNSIVEKLARQKVDEAFEEAAVLLEKSSTAVAEFEQAYEIAFGSALNAYQRDDFKEADFNNRRALALRPTSDEAQDLQSKIEKLQEIVPLIEQATSAAAENNLERERMLSLKIVELDPERTEYSDRAHEITGILKNQAFERSIARGFEAVKKEDLKSLDREINFAEKLFKDRSELEELREHKKSILKDIAFGALMADAENALASENWQAALTAFQGALQIRPDDATVAQGVELAATVLKHEKEVQSFLNEPERLTNDGVKESAIRAIKAASSYTALSKQLAYASKLLKQNIDDYNTPVDIWVKSDKKTHVSVRGVGQVGVIDKYKIRLKPGQYVFEGRREGFRVKAVTLKVKPGDNAIEVIVISDERI